MTKPTTLESLISASGASFRELTEHERQASLDAFVARGLPDDIWVFGYGSLVWRPEFDFLEQRLARVNGYHRSLCLWSRINRGTPEQPGLVFGLDVGGSCRGMAYRIASHQVTDILQELWKREMPSAAYIPKWLNCRTGQGTIRALVFTMDRGKDAYVRGLDKDQLLAIVQRAHGIYGPCAEYVLETAQALRQAGIHDRKLDALIEQLSTQAQQADAGHEPAAAHPGKKRGAAALPHSAR
ncbi:gamma-glutamylcyclotransferase [Eoetvoesiella caeni]|uniref:glutathione-specific gamma-glutamylcyclotransferase n=1 Tax=Eoetvoesiella caeni TaxID=645616 RepID=A0A366HAR2_9BURK|nr:gamma-glutamylcyclotransferase [Eoetvoesiella caeni]MCI2809283.1 gamma-glutamylcyclotransferase [Eoetvoesiella caeni]NYT54423.1 gamma-glutamylcyclotransferase [Eoetvoesiella caeni]RBP39389.1 cation transport protein ChaC [Eoetvoesiella caeni]